MGVNFLELSHLMLFDVFFSREGIISSSFALKEPSMSYFRITTQFLVLRIFPETGFVSGRIHSKRLSPRLLVRQA
jgi:hypothetical protein